MNLVIDRLDHKGAFHNLNWQLKIERLIKIHLIQLNVESLEAIVTLMLYVCGFIIHTYMYVYLSIYRYTVFTVEMNTVDIWTMDLFCR